MRHRDELRAALLPNRRFESSACGHSERPRILKPAACTRARSVRTTNMALPIDPDDIAQRDLQSFVENGVAEGILFDYKGELYVASDSEKREFLKDVSSF